MTVGESAGRRPGRRRRIVVLVTTAIVIVGVVAAAFVVGRQVRTPEQVAAEAAAPAPTNVTAAVERRRVGADLQLVGQIVAGTSVAVLPPAGSVGDTAVVTDLPAEVGDIVEEGSVLFEVAGEPVLALRLDFPLYRDIATQTRGRDVEQVQRALRRLGHRITVNGVLDDPTAAALQKLLRQRGYRSPGPAATDQTSTGPTPTDPTGTDAAGTPVLRRGQVNVIDRDGRRISAVNTRVGATLVDPATAVLELDGEASTVRVVVPVDSAAGLAAGQPAEMIDDVAGRTAQLAVRAIGADVVNDESGRPGVEVLFDFVGEALPPVERSVRIRVVDPTAGADELAVPVTAIYSRPDGRSFVTIAEPGGGLRELDVEAGRTAGGWVVIDERHAAELPVGTEVVVGAIVQGGP